LPDISTRKAIEDKVEHLGRFNDALTSCRKSRLLIDRMPQTLFRRVRMDPTALLFAGIFDEFKNIN